MRHPRATAATRRVALALRLAILVATNAGPFPAADAAPLTTTALITATGSSTVTVSAEVATATEEARPPGSFASRAPAIAARH